MCRCPTSWSRSSQTSSLRQWLISWKVKKPEECSCELFLWTVPLNCFCSQTFSGNCFLFSSSHLQMLSQDSSQDNSQDRKRIKQTKNLLIFLSTNVLHSSLYWVTCNYRESNNDAHRWLKLMFVQRKWERRTKDNLTLIEPIIEPIIETKETFRLIKIDDSMHTQFNHVVIPVYLSLQPLVWLGVQTLILWMPYPRTLKGYRIQFCIDRGYCIQAVLTKWWKETLCLSHIITMKPTENTTASMVHESSRSLVVDASVPGWWVTCKRWDVFWSKECWTDLSRRMLWKTNDEGALPCNIKVRKHPVIRHKEQNYVESLLFGASSKRQTSTAWSDSHKPESMWLSI